MQRDAQCSHLLILRAATLLNTQRHSADFSHNVPVLSGNNKYTM